MGLQNFVPTKIVFYRIYTNEFLKNNNLIVKFYNLKILKL